MDRTLRNRHRIIWMVLAVLIPTGICLAWLVRPAVVPVKLLEKERPALLPQIVASLDNGKYRVNIRHEPAVNKWQIEWYNIRPLSTPSAVIYCLDTSPGQRLGTYIGRIESTGTYVFNFKHDDGHIHLLVYDFIKEMPLDTLHFPITQTIQL